MCNDCSTSINTQIWNIPDCTAGRIISVQERETEPWASLHGNQLVFKPEAQIKSIQVFDLSMRLVADVAVSGSNKIELPSSLSGCMLVKIEAENRSSEVKKWCNFY